MTDLLLPDTRTRRIVTVAIVVGTLIGLSGAAEGPAWAGVLRVPCYAVACGLIVRFTTIVRHRLVGPLIVHEVAMAGIVLGWLVSDRPPGALINGLWLVIALVWFVVGGRRGD